MEDQSINSQKFPHVLLFNVGSGELIKTQTEAACSSNISGLFVFWNKKNEKLMLADLITRLKSGEDFEEGECFIEDLHNKEEKIFYPARVKIISCDTALLVWQSRVQGSERSFFLNRMATLGEFSSEMAHEINNPLMAIGGNLAIVEESLSAMRVSDDCLKRLTKIKRLTNTIQKIVRSAQIAARDGERDPFVSVLFSELVEDLLPLCEDKFESAGVKLQFTYEDASFDCKKVEMIQVIANLLLNALHAALDTEEKWVRLEFAVDQNEVHIKTIDSGKGISPELQQKIMLPYFTTKEAGKGTGLGLSITSEIIKSHRGKLSIDAEHQNTCFCIRFPRRFKPSVL